MAGTIQQIAELAGVSRGTVDRALNNRGRIKPEVAAKIEQIAEVQEKLEKQGIEVIVRESEAVDETEQLQAIDELEALGIGGLAIMPVDCASVRIRLNRLTKESGIPVVTFNTDMIGTERCCFVGLIIGGAVRLRRG